MYLMDQQQYSTTAIVGRPTLMAMFDGRHEARPILDALQQAGHPLADASVLFRPAGTDAVEDLVTGERPGGQSGDARMAGDKGGKTLVLLHPDEGQVEAIRAALTGLGAENIEYEPQTVYTGAQSEADFLGESVALAQELHTAIEEEKARVEAEAQAEAQRQAEAKAETTTPTETPADAETPADENRKSE
jgi:hypothetical protein